MINGVWYCQRCGSVLKARGLLRVPGWDRHIFGKIGSRSKPWQKDREAAISNAINRCANFWPYQYDPATPYPTPPPRSTTPHCLVDAGTHAPGCAHKRTVAQEHTNGPEPPQDTISPFEGRMRLRDTEESERNYSSAQTPEAHQWQYQQMEVDYPQQSIYSPEVDYSQQSTYSPEAEFNPFADAISSVEAAVGQHHTLQMRHHHLQVDYRALEAEYEKVRDQLDQQRVRVHVVDQPTNVAGRSSRLSSNHADTFTISGEERRLIEVVRRIEDPSIRQEISVWECMSFSDEE